MSCFHCEHDRPADEYSKSQMEAKQSVLRKRLEKPPLKSDISSAWNIDFDDNESDGADVAAESLLTHLRRWRAHLSIACHIEMLLEASRMSNSECLKQ
jgi:hypothetical protein